MKLLQTKPQIRKITFNYFDFFYTVINNRKEKGDGEEQDIIIVDESNYIKYNDFILPNHFVGRKSKNSLLR